MNVGNKFLEKLKTYLKKIGMNQSTIDKMDTEKIVSIFQKADKADGSEDGKVTGENFLSILKGEYSDEDLISELEQSYLDAWEALSGDDKILETAEVEDGDPVDSPSSSSGGSSGTPPATDPTKDSGKDTQQANQPKAVTAESLEGKDASTLRNERSDILSQIDGLRTEMQTAENNAKENIDKTKKEYEAALNELAEVSTTKDENNKTLKDLQDDKAKAEEEVTKQNEVITQTKADIETSKANIASYNDQLNALVEPNRADYTTTDEEGNTVFDEAGYSAALAEYQAQKAELEEKLANEEDNLSKLEQQLTADEKTLKDKQDAVYKIEEQIGHLVNLISQAEPDKMDKVNKIVETMEKYSKALEELETVKKPYEEAIETLNANLAVYDTAIQKAEQTEKEEKDKFTSPIESEEGLKYKDRIDELLGIEDEEETDKAQEGEETQESDKAQEGEEAQESDKAQEGDETQKSDKASEDDKADESESDKDEQTAEEETPVYSADQKQGLQEILNEALNDKNLTVDDKMKLLSYAKSKDAQVVVDMLKDDTFFVNAFAEMADDEKVSTERMLAMQDTYFGIQGNTEISTNFFSANGELQGSYVEADISLIEKAGRYGNLDKVVQNYERNGISLDSLVETINNTKEYSADQKEELLSRIGIFNQRENPEVTVEKLDAFGLEGEISYPKDIKEGEELPVLIFFTGCKQNGAYNGKGDNGRYLMYDKDTTPLGTMYNSNVEWKTDSDGSRRVINPEYSGDLSSFPGIIIELNSDNRSPDLEPLLESLDTNGVNGVKIQRGKTVIAGASAGVGPAYNTAMALGSDKVDELIVISNNPKDHFDSKNSKLDGITTYGYVAEGGETSYYNNMLKYIAGINSSDEVSSKNVDENGNEIVSKVKGKDGYTSNHNHVVNLLFTNDLDGDGYSDFFQKHFGKYYGKKK